MNLLDRVIVFFNSMLAGTAFVVNVKAALAVEDPWRTVRGMAAAMAGVYSLAYLFLGVFPETILTWSQTMRGVTVGAWPIVWIWPAVVLIRSAKRTKEIVQKETNE